jgi:hypothetical protein
MEFKLFTPSSLNATRAGWTRDISDGEGFLPDIEQQLDWTEKHLTLTDNSVAYGVFETNGHIAVGICELVITKPEPKKAWVKFLRLRLRPKVESLLLSNEKAGIKAAIEAYVACVVGVFHVKNAHNASIIKVYGRTQEQVRFLTFLDVALQNQKEAKFKSSIEGRWLVLKWSKN